MNWNNFHEWNGNHPLQTKSIVFLLKATTKYISNIIMFAKQKNELGPSAESRTPNCKKN